MNPTIRLVLGLAVLVLVVVIGGLAAFVYPFWRELRKGWGH